MTRLDEKEDVLVIQTYLVDVEVPFLCDKQTLELWNFKIDGREKILEIQLKSDQDCSKKLIRMVDTTGGHYGITFKTRKKGNSNLFFIDDSGVLFMEDEKGDLCSFKSVRKVHKVNHHKRKEQLMAAYRNAGWMSPELANIITHMVNDCKVCQKFQRLVARLRVHFQKLLHPTKSSPWI